MKNKYKAKKVFKIIKKDKEEQLMKLSGVSNAFAGNLMGKNFYKVLMVHYNFI